MTPLLRLVQTAIATAAPTTTATPSLREQGCATCPTDSRSSSGEREVVDRSKIKQNRRKWLTTKGTVWISTTNLAAAMTPLLRLVQTAIATAAPTTTATPSLR
uniref:Uncharacterized protein n=1 Tax=Rhizophora mucronata TaxID=61149 RepID=A0A2P2IKS3_RHIMU